jgi:hypothetical protein
MNDIYAFTVPIFTKTLTALDGLLTKAETGLSAKGLDEKTLLESRLAPDMFPLKKQIQIACDNAKGAAARLSGMEPPVHADEEQTFADLHARIQKTLDFIKSVPESSFADAETHNIVLPYFPGKHLSGLDYAREYVVPNFFFHVTTAYAILRKEGLEIGKADYLGGLSLQED